MISHEKFIFARMPRTASGFTRKFIMDNIDDCEEAEDGHQPIPHGDDRFRFGALRNPFDWYVSWWQQTMYNHQNYKHPVWSDIQHRGGYEFANFLQLEHNIGGKNTWVDYDVVRKLDIGTMTYFYLKVLCNFDFDSSDIQQANLLLDKLFVYEDLESSVTSIVQRFSGKTENQLRRSFKKVKRENKSFLRDSGWKIYHSNETIALIKHKDRLLFDRHADQFRIYWDASFNSA